MFKYLFAITASLVFLLSLFVAIAPAQAAIDCGKGFELDSAGVTCIPSGGATSGLAGATTYMEVLQMVLEILLSFAGAVSVLAIVYSGIQYLTSGGNEQAAKDARANLQYAIIGVIVTLLAYTIVRVVITTFTA